MRHTRVLGAVLLLAALTGCGGEDDARTPGPSAASTPAVYTAEELTAALPSADHVGNVESTRTRCPDDEDDPSCELFDGAEYLASVHHVLTPKSLGSDEEDEAAASVSWLDDLAIVQATLHPSVGEREAVAEKWQAEREQFDGDFDTSPESFDGGGFLPGERGSGTVEDIEVEGWTGVVATRSHVLVAPDGRTSERRLETQIAVSQGGAERVHVLVDLRELGRDAGDAEDLARRILTDYIARLA